MKRKRNYRYVILGSCFLLMAFPFSIINSIHSLFITPVTTTLGFTKTAFSFLFTISSLTVAIFSPLIGKLIHYISLRIVMTVCSLLAGFGFIAYGFCNQITSFYLVSFFVAIGLTGLTTIPVSVMLTNWFPEKIGTALGIAFAGIGTGTFVFMQIISRIIINKGYAFAYLFLGIMILIVTFPISVYLVEKEPLIADSSNLDVTNSTHAQDFKNKRHNTKVHLAKGMGFETQTKKGLPYSKTFFLFLSALFLLGIIISGTKIHVQPYLDTTGYNAIHNANVGSTIAFVSLFGNLAAGRLFDKLGLRNSIYLYGCLNFLSCICLWFVGINWISYLFAICFGLTLNLPSLLPSYGVTVLFHEHDYSTTLGFTNAMFTLGSSIGPTLTGFFADHRFGYRGAWVLYAVIVVLYMIFLSFTTKERASNGNSFPDH